MRMILVRHGQTTSNIYHLLDTAVPGAELDDVGRRQADGLVGRLAGLQIPAVHSSLLIRAQQTAAPLAAARGLPVRVLDGLREIGAGDDEMSPDASRYLGTIMGWRQDPWPRIPGGENGREFFSRFDAAIATVASAGDGSLLVSHGAALCTWATARVRGFADALGPHPGLANATVVTIDGDPEEGWTFVGVDAVESRAQGAYSRHRDD